MAIDGISRGQDGPGELGGLGLSGRVVFVVGGSFGFGLRLGGIDLGFYLFLGDSMCHLLFIHTYKGIEKWRL